MQRRTLMAAVLAASLLLGNAEAETFVHRFQAGTMFRALTEVDETVYINRRLSHRATILNRIAFEVLEVRADGAGLLSGEFRVSSRAESGAAWVTEQLYRSEYWETPAGRFEIGPEYFMPVVRHVPSFPARELAPGDTWTAPGEERHDFREDFGIPDPYVIPFDATYTYVGPVELDGKTVHLIESSYAVFQEPGVPKAWGFAYPVRIAGHSSQRLYWNAEEGRLERYDETFRFVFDLSTGDSVEYRGTAEGTFTEATPLDRGAVAEELRQALGEVEGASVAEDERGVSVTLENLRFAADSTRLLPGEEEKLALIAEVLARYPERDVLVAGHTALAGTAEQRMALSLSRARAVAELLASLGARSADRIVVEGYGAERPVAPNDTEANMARNRRVEIIILEN
ncbi:MAG TPA: OmpA family protein [Spirochaetales bacterium]|nr:OmpA family protein [Spirochaetales bacterium]